VSDDPPAKIRAKRTSRTALEAGYGREDPRDGFRASMTGRGSCGAAATVNPFLR
jgi:hypothetical protein